MKNILVLLSISVFLFSFVSASLTEYDIDNIDNIESDSLEFSAKECSSISYKILSPFIRGFEFELKDEDNDENLIFRLNENNCIWYLKEISVVRKADIIVYGIFEGNSFLPDSLKLNTFKSRILFNMIDSKTKLQLGDIEIK